jgi:hypothetical protein
MTRTPPASESLWRLQVEVGLHHGRGNFVGSGPPMARRLNTLSPPLPLSLSLSLSLSLILSLILSLSFPLSPSLSLSLSLHRW